MGRIIYVPEFIVVLKALDKGPKTTMDIHRDWLLSYSYVGDIRKEFVKRGWVIISGKGRQSKFISLTGKGREVLNAAEKLLFQMDVDTSQINLYRMKKQRPKPSVEDKDIIPDKYIRREEDDVYDNNQNN